MSACMRMCVSVCASVHACMRAQTVCVRERCVFIRVYVYGVPVRGLRKPGMCERVGDVETLGGAYAWVGAWEGVIDGRGSKMYND
jgi:hypothetical protein